MRPELNLKRNIEQTGNRKLTQTGAPRNRIDKFVGQRRYLRALLEKDSAQWHASSSLFHVAESAESLGGAGFRPGLLRRTGWWLRRCVIEPSLNPSHGYASRGPL